IEQVFSHAWEMCRVLRAKLLARESNSPTLGKAASASGRRERHDVDAEQVGVPDGFPLQRSSDRVFLLLLHLSMIHPDDSSSANPNTAVAAGLYAIQMTRGAMNLNLRNSGACGATSDISATTIASLKAATEQGPAIVNEWRLSEDNVVRWLAASDLGCACGCVPRE